MFLQGGQLCDDVGVGEFDRIPKYVQDSVPTLDQDVVGHHLDETPKVCVWQGLDIAYKALGVEIADDVICEGVNEMCPLVGKGTMVPPLATELVQGLPKLWTWEPIGAGSKPCFKKDLDGMGLEIGRDGIGFKWRCKQDVVDTKETQEQTVPALSCHLSLGVHHGLVEDHQDPFTQDSLVF